MKIKEALHKGVALLKEANIETPEIDAKALLLHSLQIDFSELLLISEDTIDEEASNLFFSKIESRLKNKPISYIIGEKEFFSLTFKVDPNVLIPRPETEILVEHAINFLREKSNPLLLDICTGSGNIPITICHEFKKSLKACAFDISFDALKIAQINKAFHEINNLLFFCQDAAKEIGLKVRFDLITANPPYIPIERRGSIQKDVEDFEPSLALFAVNRGCEIIFPIIQKAKDLLKEGGLLLMEISDDEQAGDIEAWFVEENLETIFTKPEFIKDYAGIKRILKLNKK